METTPGTSVFKQRVKREPTRGEKTRFMQGTKIFRKAGFSLGMRPTRRQWSNVYKTRREKDNCQPRILYSAKIFFQREIKLLWTYKSCKNSSLAAPHYKECWNKPLKQRESHSTLNWTYTRNAEDQKW